MPGVEFQEVGDGNRWSYKDFSITIDADAFGLTRDELYAALTAENIETRKYYDPPVHRQVAYQLFATPEHPLSNTELLASSILNLPIWSDMNTSVVSGVCLAVERAHEFADAIRAEVKRETFV